MANQRRHKRFVVEGMDVYARTIFNTDAEIINISTTGVSVRIPRRLNMGGIYSLKFDSGGNRFAIEGTVIWEKLTGSKETPGGEVIPFYTAGIEFHGALADKSKQIRTFITQKMTEIRERRLSGIRIKVTGDSIVLSQPEACRVRDISIGGMRVETSHEIPAGTEFSLELMLPEHEPPMTCSGKVAFCLDNSGGVLPRWHVMGIEFTKISADDTERLKRFVDTLGDPSGL